MSLIRSKDRLRFKAEPSAADDRSDEQAIEMVAVRLLARREHSAGEIKRKLLLRGCAAPAIDAVLIRLTDQGALSDPRFVCSFIKHHVERGHGPTRIRAELRQQGVASELIEEQLGGAEIDWAEVAAQVRSRKFRVMPRSMPERAKQSRFLQYRGFSSEQIRAAMGPLCGAGETDPEAADVDPDSHSFS